MGDWNEDFSRGQREKGWSNQPGAEAYNAGAAQAKREQQHAFVEEQRRAREQEQARLAAASSAVSAPGYPAPSTTFDRTSAPSTYQGAGASGVSTLGSSAKAGAFLLLVLFGLYALLGPQAWTAPQLLGSSAAAALAGALAGAALYIAFKLLVLALRIALVLLAVGIALHLFGAIDLPHVLNQLWSLALRAR